jgi:hypothetical protein
VPAELTPRQLSCCECDAMWREYALATAEHLKLLLERDMATAARDETREDELGCLIPKAEVRRTLAREDIREHESASHTGKAANGYRALMRGERDPGNDSG